MSDFPKFTEYLNASGKVVENMPVEENPDYKGPKKTKPDKDGAWPLEVDGKTKSKNAGTKSGYSGPGSDPGQKKGEKGFGDEGDKSLKYNPVEKVKDKEGGKKLSSWDKKTEQFVGLTKGMTPAEYATFMSERTIRGVELDAVRYVASNPLAIQALIRELNRDEDGQPEILINELLGSPSLRKIIMEKVAPPMHKHDDDKKKDDPVPDPPEEAGELKGKDFNLPEDDDEDEDKDEDWWKEDADDKEGWSDYEDEEDDDDDDDDYEREEAEEMMDKFGMTADEYKPKMTGGRIKEMSKEKFDKIMKNVRL